MKFFKSALKKILVILLGIPLLIGCDFTSESTEETRGIYMERALSTESFIEIGSQDLEEMISYQINGEKYDFVLMVYATDCSACTLAKSHIKKLVGEEGYKIYAINKVSYDILAEDEDLDLPAVGGTPQFLFFSNREVVGTIDGVYPEYDQFKEQFAEMDKYPNANCYDVNDYTTKTTVENDETITYNEYAEDTTETLDNLIATESEVTVLFTWKVCGDCANLYDSFYLDYMNENSDKNFYCFEVNYFRLTKPSYEPEDKDSEEYANWLKWTEFANKYGFGTYRHGKVPSLVKFVDGEFSEMAVYANEGKAVQNDDGTYSYPKAYAESVRAITADNENDLKVKANLEEIRLFKELY